MTHSISVITATFNSMAVLPRLAESLAAQASVDFEWIVVDGGSVDGTCTYLKEFASHHPWCRFTSQPDFGIYDALNRGISSARHSHYVVAGSDDRFFYDALGQYAHILEREADVDIVLARIEINGVVRGGFRPSRAWLGHQRVFQGSHSIGMLIKVDLHHRFGFYSNRFPMLADGFFLKRALHSDNTKFYEADFVAGEFALGGLSSSNKLQSLAESWQIQMLTENNKAVQMLLFAGKVFLRLPWLLRKSK